MASVISNKTGVRKLVGEIWKNKSVYTILLPGLLWYFIFVYGPMVGLSLAFKTYSSKLGIWNSPWVGLLNFQNVFRDANFMRSIWRTLYINIGRLLFEFPMPVLMAIFLNELRIRKYKRIVQTIMTFPHFLSWVVVSSILINLLSLRGPINTLIESLNFTPIHFLGTEKLFQPFLYITANWKSIGWSSIIYLAAIAGIDMEQYEAAEIDGASRFQRIIYITLPSILPTVSVMFILAMGGLMSGGFDQIFNLNNAAVKNAAETIDIYIYRITFQSAPDFGFSMAVSMFRSIVNMGFLVLAHRGSKMMGGSGIIS